MGLRAVGYFSTRPGDRRPDVRSQIDTFWELARKPRIVIYLRAGAVFEPSTVMGRCNLCPEPVGTRDLTDGVWLWPEGLAHYVEKHAVRLPDELVTHMAGLHFRVPKVDIKLLKLAASGLLDAPRETAGLPPVTSPTVPQTPGARPSSAPRPPSSPPGPVAADLDDATAALPLGDAWLASVTGIVTHTPLVPFSEPVIVGRDKSAAQVVVAHGSVSRRHCRLIPGAHGVIVQDLDSQNGVLVKGRKVAQAELRDGDAFHIGPATVRVKRAPT